MNTSPKRVDWRDGIRGLPLAAISEEGIKPLGSGDKQGTEDETARSAVERISDRPGPNRWSEA